MGLLATGCGGPSPEGPAADSAVPADAAGTSTDQTGSPAAVPAAMRPCQKCHYSIVASYLGHGMARSIGRVGRPDGGRVHNAATGLTYEVAADPDGPWLTATLPDGGRRRQRLVGRIGAGIFDTSWVGDQVDPLTGAASGRLFFAPVETLTGRGLELAPFDLTERSPGLDLALTAGCLSCHTTDRLARLPGAARADGPGADVYPANALGSDAFEQLSPITCEACHGDPARHLALVTDPQAMAAAGEEIGLPRLGRLPVAERRDLCARCHLQGEARFELVEGRPTRDRPIAGQIAVLVPSRPDADFRFVGQVERLALSACFAGSPRMTCSTCHRPHVAVAAQGTAAFDAACVTCHQAQPCTRPDALTVEEVTGEPARTESGCVDCHVRRSQPFDLPHVRTADHWIRRRIERPQTGLPHRQFADPEAAPVLFADRRLEAQLATPEGRRWKRGVLAVGLLTMGRVREAVAAFDDFPPPGTPAAVEATAPAGLVAVETHPSFHQMRGLALMASGRLPEALAAFGDALQLDPLSPGALMSRARVRFDTGDVAGALEDTQRVIDVYPRAEAPWDLRAEMAERLGRPDLATRGFLASTARWPANPVTWLKLGLLLRQQGDLEGADRALARAHLLRPGLDPGNGPSR